MKYLIYLISLFCVLSVCSCEKTGDDLSTDNENSSDITAFNTDLTTDTTEISEDNVYLNQEGHEFASDFRGGDVSLEGSIVKYWDTGTNRVKFEQSQSDGAFIFKINDNIIDIGAYMKIDQILVADEFVVITTGGTDINTFPIYIFDYNGKTLFKTYYLSNTGMVNSGFVELDDNKIIIYGGRTTHGPSLMIEKNNYWLKPFEDYADYLYEGEIYDYGPEISYEVYLDISNIDQVLLLNPNEIISATFELDYLGNGKFDKIKMIEVNFTMADAIKSIMKSKYRDIEFDYWDFVHLDWKNESEVAYPYVYLDDILEINEQAYYIGPVPKTTYPDGNFYFYIGDKSHALFNYPGFLYYRGKLEPKIGDTNIEEYDDEFLGKCYKYTGDGSEVKYEPCFKFIIPDLSYNDYQNIIHSMAEVIDGRANDIKLIYEHEYFIVDDLPEALNIEDFDSIMDNEALDISTRAMRFPDYVDQPFYIQIDWLSGTRFRARNFMTEEIYPFDESLKNAACIHIYWSDDSFADEITDSDMPDTSEEIDEFNISGKYICSSEYFKDEYFSAYPDSVPCVYFSGDGDCIFFVNYMEGGCDIEGKYVIENDKIHVKLDFSNTIFESADDEYANSEFMSDTYIFTIVSGDEITINRNCYGVIANDLFVAVD
ncbi:MAG: hypothetical protein HFE63_01700 [Clostridiales bacterium]|nr:hypothetical protein [Clostridiales bacterium]